jgi:hypothetical protein
MNDIENLKKEKKKLVGQTFVHDWDNIAYFLDPNVKSISSKIHFCIIECNYDVIDLILVMYDVQYDVVAYGSKIKWIYLFANHKGPTRMLNS